MEALYGIHEAFGYPSAGALESLLLWAGSEFIRNFYVPLGPACSYWAHVRRCAIELHSTMQFRNTGHLHVTSIIRNAEKAWGQVRKHRID